MTDLQKIKKCRQRSSAKNSLRKITEIKQKNSLKLEYFYVILKLFYGLFLKDSFLLFLLLGLFCYHNTSRAQKRF